MTPPSVPFSVWILGAFDPVLLGVALVLGWKADQFGKVFIAAIAALGISLIFEAIAGRIGLPWIAPLTQDGPTLIPVRSVAALGWAILAYLARSASRSRRPP